MSTPLSRKRKRDSIKVLDTSPSTSQELARNYQCINCKERNYLTFKADTIHLFCTNCGHLTPTRTAKHSRGLAAPVGQQQTFIVQSKNVEKGTDRRPYGINRKKNPLEESLIQKGYTVIDSQTIEPT
jgi:transcription elongation factor Elf1